MSGFQKNDIVMALRKVSFPEFLVVSVIGWRFPFPVEESSLIRNGRRNVLQAVWNLKRGDTKESRSLLANLGNVYPQSFHRLGEASPATCLPIREGKVLDILRRDFTIDKLEERKHDIFSGDDNDYLIGCVVILLRACDLDLAERDILPRGLFKLLVESWLAGDGRMGFAKTWLNRQLELARKDGFKKKHILEKLQGAWDERKLRRRLDCHLAKGRLSDAEDYRQIFRAVMALRGIPLDCLDDMVQDLFGIFCVAAALDFFYEKNSFSWKYTDFSRWYDTADRWFEDNLV